jgi:hypothetical protein
MEKLDIVSCGSDIVLHKNRVQCVTIFTAVVLHLVRDLVQQLQRANLQATSSSENTLHAVIKQNLRTNATLLILVRNDIAQGASVEWVETGIHQTLDTQPRFVWKAAVAIPPLQNDTAFTKAFMDHFAVRIAQLCNRYMHATNALAFTVRPMFQVEIHAQGHTQQQQRSVSVSDYAPAALQQTAALVAPYVSADVVVAPLSDIPALIVDPPLAEFVSPQLAVQPWSGPTTVWEYAAYLQLQVRIAAYVCHNLLFAGPPSKGVRLRCVTKFGLLYRDQQQQLRTWRLFWMHMYSDGQAWSRKVAVFNNRLEEDNRERASHSPSSPSITRLLLAVASRIWHSRTTVSTFIDRDAQFRQNGIAVEYWLEHPRAAAAAASAWAMEGTKRVTTVAPFIYMRPAQRRWVDAHVQWMQSRQAVAQQIRKRNIQETEREMKKEQRPVVTHQVYVPSKRSIPDAKQSTESKKRKYRKTKKMNRNAHTPDLT